MSSKTRYLLAGLLVVAGVVYLIVSNTGSTAQFFYTIEELNNLDDEVLGRNIRVSGAILGDTIVYDTSIPRVTFTVVQVPGDPQEVEAAGGLAAVLHAAVNDPQAPRLEVVFDDVKPDLLQHEAQAIMQGQIAVDGTFHADEVLLSCPSRYEEGVPDQVEGN